MCAYGVAHPILVDQGELLGTTLLRYGLAARRLAQHEELPRRIAEQARAGCDRASRLMESRMPARKCRDEWDDFLEEIREFPGRFQHDEGLAWYMYTQGTVGFAPTERW